VSEAVAPILVLVLLLNFAVLGISRLRAVITASAAQGIALGALTPLFHHDYGPRTVLITLGAISVKGFLIPFMLNRAMRDLQIRREVEPFIGLIPSMLLGAVATGLAMVFAQSLPLVPEHAGTLMLPTSLATILTGFIVLTTRRKAITQVVRSATSCRSTSTCSTTTLSNRGSRSSRQN
jgi:hydrogenase-4 component E